MTGLSKLPGNTTAGTNVIYYKTGKEVNRAIIILYLLCFFAASYTATAQEHVAAVNYNPLLSKQKADLHKAKRTTAATPLSLPFFEDFTGYGVYPDTNKWVDYEVYINNTMCVSPVSRGVATFDALNTIGMPYDSLSNTDFIYADSLTSQPIDMSSDSAGDSVYFSFYYQPQGNGFYPLPQDSLMLFFKDVYGGFVKVWSTPGSTIQPFQQVMIPITDSFYFHNSFQFRFVNIAALYWADAIWNVDYIKLDVNRSAGDTTVSDVAFTSDPSFLLNDYAFMPYNQFMANAAGELAAQVTDTLQNDTAYSQTVSYSLSVSDRASGSVLCSDAPTLAFLPGYQAKQVSDPLAISVAGLPTYPANTKVTFRSTYSMISTPATGVTANDTIVKDQVFDNYLAYDDGTAEKSYYLNLFPTLDGRIAIEYHLNEPDTLRGLAIYFGKQLPYPTYKTFNMFVYSSLAGVNGALADAPIDSQEFQVPFYSDTQDHFWVYTFDNPLVLPAGTFYAGTQQPAASGDDSLYFGLDVNRVGSNHAYFRVLDVWEPSLISGAIMIRPILGRHVIGNGITSVTPAQPQWKVMPDPAKDVLQFQFEGDKQADYYITDVSGHTVLQGIIFNDKTIDISGLVPGLYLVNLMHNGVAGAPQKIIKL